MTYLYHAPTQKLHFQYDIKKKQTLFLQMCKVLGLLLATAMTFQIPFFFFFFFYNGFLYWIYLEMAGICNIILVMSQLFLLLGSTSSIISGISNQYHDVTVIQRFTVLH